MRIVVEVAIDARIINFGFYLALLIAAFCKPACLRAQDPLEPPPSRDLPLREFLPVPRANLSHTDLQHAKFPVVDCHSHFWIRLQHDPHQLDEFIRLMDRNHIAVCVSLDGQLGAGLLPGRIDEQMDYLWREHKDRFAIFANINWRGTASATAYADWACNQPDFAHQTVLALEAAHARGISGVKVFKSFGLHDRNPDGSLIEIDDARFDPIWSACGRLGLPVIMHTADPSAFFEPITPNNERYEELSRHPDWHFPPEKFPTREALHAARNRLFARHPATTFIAAHLGNDGEDLQQAGEWLERYPNVYMEIASRIAELGRQPYTARDFLIRFQDRILFGTDGPWPEQRYRLYWRFLETRDEYFPYSEKEFPPQGLWRIYGVHLPDPVLKKIYHGNAAKILPGIAERIAVYGARENPASAAESPAAEQ
ncbi:MAG: amidohydrolase family protein [Pirellulaceae bacterium]